LAIRSPERGDRPDRPNAVGDLHRRIDEKRKQLDRRRTARRDADRGFTPDVASDSAVSDNSSDKYGEAPRPFDFRVDTPVREARPRTMAGKSKGPVERNADLIDVHILDMAAQIEALLRSVREVQENVLRVRGALPPIARQHPAVAVQSRLAGMLRECDALRDAVLAAAATVERLIEPVGIKRHTE
jgi:hypothetical protein